MNGLILICENDFKVKNVVYNFSQSVNSDFIGKNFIDLFTEDSRIKAENFIEKIMEEGVAFEWQINLQLENDICELNFSGSKFNDNFIIFGLKSKSDISFLYEELMLINNEQANEIRKVYKDLFSGNKTDNIGEEDYNEISRMNNELTNLQRELNKKNSELSRLNKLKNQFLGMAAHDLRNPLNVILSYSEFILKHLSKDLTADHIDFISTINKSSFFMLNLVEELLDVSKIESGKLDLKLEEADIILLLSEIIKCNEIFAQNKNVRLKFSTGVESLNMTYDPGKIEQVIQNLLSNAVKFSNPNSDILINASLENNELLVAVKDSGIGIEKENLDKIFNPFTKVSLKGTAGEKTTGLGLSICKRIIEGHGGRIWVESKIGEGSVFNFSLNVD